MTGSEPGVALAPPQAARRSVGNEWITRTILGTAALGTLAAAYVPALRDFATAGSATCPFLEATGHQCPLCGMTRATLALMNGDVTSYIAHHPFALIVITGLAWMLADSFGLVRRPLLRWGRPTRLAIAGATVAAFAIYAVARNLF